MDTARLYAERGTCSRKQVGAVISRDGRILSTGYNGAPKGMRHCNHECDCRARLPLHEPKCASLQPCLIAVHAEANAIAFAARYGVGIEGAEMHTTCTMCVPCAQLIVNSGIVRVVAWDPYRDLRGWSLLADAGLQIEWFDRQTPMRYDLGNE